MERAQFARELELDLGKEARVQDIVRALMQVPGGFHRLASLSVSAFQSDAYSPAQLTYLYMAVAWLVGQSTELKYLCISLKGLPYLPCLPHIQHLQLTTSGGTLSSLAPVLASMVSLQTLCLIATDNLAQAQLDLQALTQLQSVRLEDIMPISLNLASGTALHAIVKSVADARNFIWHSTAARGILRSFTLEAPHEQIEKESQIPNWMLGPAVLETLVLSLRSFGKKPLFCETIMLEGALACAERLCIDCQEGLYVVVPKVHKWRLVNFKSIGVLSVRFQSVTQFALSCPAFSFEYSTFEGVQLISLARAMLEHGMGFVEAETGEIGSMFHSVCRNELDLDLHDDSHSICKCGACHNCCRPDNFQGPRVPCNDWPSIYL